MNKQIGRKRYSIEFKLEAVRLANESGRSKTQIARELDVSRAMIYNWCKTFRSQGETAFKAVKANKVDVSSESQELKRLRIENKQLREDREILKKAAAYFAKELK